MIIMTRRVTFSAAHANWIAGKTRTENETRFGPSAGPEPHGHNYLLDVSVQGNIAPDTGILVNIKEIDRIVKEKIVQVLDRKFINRQVPAFADRPVTAENVAAFVAEELAPHLPEEAPLCRLRL
jgi:6-pyruvoyltetrahydropterin/6-carboxytetrahydropterin synthase